MARSLIILSLVAFVMSGAFWLKPDPWKIANEKSSRDAQLLTGLIDSPDRIGWRMSEDISLIRAILWDAEGRRRYPPPDGLAPLAYEFSDDDVRDLAKRQSMTANLFWGPFDIPGAQILHCRHMPAICLIYDRRLLEENLQLSVGALSSEAPGRLWHLLFAIGMLSGGSAFFLRRRSAPSSQSLVLEPQHLNAKRGSLDVPLSPRDLKLLTLLEERDGAVVTKDELYDAGWGRDFMPNSRALDQHIINLRRKLDPEKSRPPLIETVRGVGYRMKK